MEAGNEGNGVQQIAADLCHPFGIVVVVGRLAAKAAAENIASFALEDGETVQDTRWSGSCA